MKKTIISTFLACWLYLGLVNNICAQTMAGTVKTLLGSASVQRGNESLAVTKEMSLYSKDVIETTASAFVGMMLTDGTRITAGANTKLNLANYEFNPETQKGVMKVNVVKGIIQVASGTLGKTSRENVQFNSPTASIGIRGTNFVIEVGSDDEDFANESTTKN
ncbi:FecR domain-containing protein [Polynucleobacter sp. JS-Fieb-80-E5]|uniref:FecR family protein n=1 Tax=Polynucleobacter sp. JS-Fieb-80-E5 TaxID=2081050 RepID=UPI001C0CD773|nr:FecR domain-containing protein [Polynucleobacter sp. JS-Fieb-80-E5]MBU3617843.1 FecR domain-containing protein [Polynucleobacter sp. JS-Fieb-80-E5]